MKTNEEMMAEFVEWASDHYGDAKIYWADILLNENFQAMKERVEQSANNAQCNHYSSLDELKDKVNIPTLKQVMVEFCKGYVRYYSAPISSGTIIDELSDYIEKYLKQPYCRCQQKGLK